MIGTRASNAAWKIEVGMGNGGADNMEPGAGGGSVAGPWPGMNWKMEGSKRAILTEDISES